jgi:hypothetical protein
MKNQQHLGDTGRCRIFVPVLRVALIGQILVGNIIAKSNTSCLATTSLLLLLLLVLVGTTVEVVVGRREAWRWTTICGLFIVYVLIVAGRTHTSRRILWRVLIIAVVCLSSKATVLVVVRSVRSTKFEVANNACKKDDKTHYEKCFNKHEP